MLRVARAWCLGALASLAACSAAPAPPVDEDPSIQIGTGTWRFEPIVEGEEVPLVRGAQGGWHVWVSVGVRGVESSLGQLTFEIQPADEHRPAETASVGVQLDPPDATGMRSYLGWAAILSDASCMVGELLRVRATLTTSAGTRVTDERYVLVGAGDLPPPPCAP